MVRLLEKAGLGRVRFGVNPFNRTQTDKILKMLDTLTLSHWSECVEQDFQVCHGSYRFALKLISVTALGAESGYRRQPYSLLFAGPLTPLLPQATYPLQNGSMGELGIFLVPLGPQGPIMRYEAIFT